MTGTISDLYSFSEITRIENAACAKPGVDPEIFFADRTEPWKINAAREVCAVCPGREQCLDGALRRGEKHGVWGGTSEKERRKLRAALRPQLVAEQKERRRRQVLDALRWGPVDTNALRGLVEGADAAVRVTLQTLRKEGLVDARQHAQGEKVWFLVAQEEPA